MKKNTFAINVIGKNQWAAATVDEKTEREKKTLLPWIRKSGTKGHPIDKYLLFTGKFSTSLSLSLLYLYIYIYN